LKSTLEALDIRLLDHIVVGAGETVSFSERGLI
jgi:DNA repair protein RadC